MKIYPIWVKNLVYLARIPKEDRHAYIVSLVTAMSGSIQRWLDTTTVKGDPKAQKVVTHLYRALARIADFSLLVGDSEVKRIYIRLRGMA